METSNFIRSLSMRSITRQETLTTYVYTFNYW